MIGVASWTKTKADLRRLAKALDAGARAPAADFELNYRDGAALMAEITKERIKLLGVLKDMGKATIYALAKKSGRNYSNVHADVTRLKALGLIETDAARKIFVPWSELHIRLPLARAA
ncbi:MAG: hypothetical protein FJX47_10890 [Alphaproteobacteria bacterium]|nr:hypothetical protein [Alphaproteobacteria bacterium]